MGRSAKRALDVVVIGRSKVGRTLARALAAAGHAVRLRARRRPLPRTALDAELIVLATRDGDLATLATELATARAVTARAAVLHVAGGLDAEVLAPLRGLAAGVGQLHPFLSFAAASAPPRFDGAVAYVSGDRVAVRRATALARALGMTPRAWPRLDRARYHAAAALVANGAVALSAGGATLLRAAGAPERDVTRALAALLRSVADNVARVGLPGALTGPVRRGDAATIVRHLRALGDAAPLMAPLYVESARAQLPLARALGDADAASLDAVERTLRAGPTEPQGASGRGSPRRR